MSVKGRDWLARFRRGVTMGEGTRNSTFWHVAAIGVTAIGMSACTSGPSQFKAYEGPELPLAEVAVLRFQPWSETASLKSIRMVDTTVFDTKKDYYPVSGFYESGWHEVDVLLKPGVYDVQYRGRCPRSPEAELTESMAMEAGHRYRLNGGGCFTLTHDLRLWIEDETTGHVVVGSKDQDVR